MPESTRNYFEPRFGYDFSHVRVHMDSRAAESAQAVNALAYTVGRDIVFRKGEYTLNTLSGNRLLAHELMHVVQQGYAVAGSALPVVQRQEPATSPRADELYANWFRNQWSQQTTGRDLAERIKHFLYLNSLASFWLLKADRKTREKTGVSEKKTLIRQYNLFMQQTGDELIKDLVADPAKGMTIWEDVLKRYFTDIEKRRLLSEFKSRLESRLLDAYTAPWLTSLRKAGASMPATEEMRRIADNIVRQIIVTHRLDYYNAVAGGIRDWAIPLILPNHWPTIVSNAGAISGGAGSILTVFTGTLLVPLGVGLIAAGVAAAVYISITSIEREKEDYRQRVLELRIREELLVGYERIVERIEAQEDLLAMLCTAEAVKARLNLRSISRDELRRFVWSKLFGDFPEDLTAGRRRVKAEMDMTFNERLS